MTDDNIPDLPGITIQLIIGIILTLKYVPTTHEMFPQACNTNNGLNYAQF